MQSPVTKLPGPLTVPTIGVVGVMLFVEFIVVTFVPFDTVPLDVALPVELPPLVSFVVVVLPVVVELPVVMVFVPCA